MRRFIFCLKFVFFLCVFSLSIDTSFSKAIEYDLPNLDFVIAAHKTIDNKKIQGVHFFKLYCALGSCKLEQLSLNECKTVNSVYGFYLKAISWSTESDTLAVLPLSKNQVEVTIFQGTHHQLPASMVIEYYPEIPFAKNVIKFSTKDFIDLNQFPKLIKSDYHLIESNLLTEKIECPVFLHD